MKRIKVYAHPLKIVEDKLQKVIDMIADIQEQLDSAICAIPGTIIMDEQTEEFEEAAEALVLATYRLEPLSDNINAIMAYTRDIREQGEAEANREGTP